MTKLATITRGCDASYATETFGSCELGMREYASYFGDECMIGMLSDKYDPDNEDTHYLLEAAKEQLNDAYNKFPTYKHENILVVDVFEELRFFLIEDDSDYLAVIDFLISLLTEKRFDTPVYVTDEDAEDIEIFQDARYSNDTVLLIDEDELSTLREADGSVSELAFEIELCSKKNGSKYVEISAWIGDCNSSANSFVAQDTAIDVDEDVSDDDIREQLKRLFFDEVADFVIPA